MINVFRNPNFPTWFNVMFNGKLVDNAKSYAKALEIAQELSQRTRSPILTSK
jgi:hypothetical protein